MSARPAARPWSVAGASRASSTLAVLVGSLAAGVTVVLAVAAGCSYDKGDAGGGIGFHDGGGADAADAQYFDIGDDVAVVRDKLCGEPHEGSCDPDQADLCTPRDGGADAGPSDGAGTDGPRADLGTDLGPELGVDDAGDETAVDTAPPPPPPPPVDDAATDGPAGDTFGSGTRTACRVVRLKNQPATACAAAGLGPIDAWCTSDADCAPGLGCVGEVPAARCLPYCCSAGPGFDPCHAKGRYCTPLPLAARPTDRVPVCVEPDHCTLLSDVDTCQKGTTCTVVTSFGDTTCVPVGSCRDLQLCNNTACDRGYACLGPSADRRCRKLCHARHDEECPAGKCETATSIPSGFGICAIADAGATSDAGGTCN